MQLAFSLTALALLFVGSAYATDPRAARRDVQPPLNTQQMAVLGRIEEIEEREEGPALFPSREPGIELGAHHVSGLASERFVPVERTAQAATDLVHVAAAERGAERYELHTRYLNHQLPRMLRTIGFDKVYERAEGAHFWDADGNDHLDMLAGFGVMGLGRHHPVVRKALHDVLDASLADLTRFDCQPLPGLLVALRV